MNFKIAIVVFTLVFWQKGVSQKKNYDISKIKVSKYIGFEKLAGGYQIRTNQVYPSKKDISIISYMRQNDNIPNVDLIIRYAFSKKDSLMKEIQYEFDIINFEDQIDKKQNLDFRKALVSHYLSFEEDLTSSFGKSKIKGKLSKNTHIDDRKDYYKMNTWILDNTKLELFIEMSNTINYEKFKYPVHKMIMKYKVTETPNIEYIIRKKRRLKSIPKKFTNRSRTPLLKKCRKTPTDACFMNTISDLVLKEAKRKKLILKNDTLKIGIDVKTNGKASLGINQTKNSELKKLVNQLFSSMETIEPAYSDYSKKYTQSSTSWYIIIKDNEMVNRFK
ncbi:hypothetical protein [uncultured Tenacibaculum sp.]|uniref:hypothetical protein n=1 Tax=uncultured Tenacibaculum sp. TaxID=174713 RepID=UPI002623BFE2|nr:hypothetical protein [uncultured Tenacibaculum sp.]